MGFTALTSKSTNALLTLFTANNDQFEKLKTLTCLEEMDLCVIPLYKHGNLKIIYTLLLVELSYFV